jgi:phage shock protein C
MNKLYRSKNNRIIAGVCSGIGEYFKVDPTVVRLLWLFVSILSAGAGGVIAYIIAWIIIPEEP